MRWQHNIVGVFIDSTIAIVVNVVDTFFINKTITIVILKFKRKLKKIKEEEGNQTIRSFS